MKRFSYFVAMAAVMALTVPALLTGCNAMRSILGGDNDDEELNPGGGVASMGNVSDLDLTNRIPAPYRGAGPVTSIGDDQSVEWKAESVEWADDGDTPLTDTVFGTNTKYVAVVTLTAKPGYTFSEGKKFTHTGASTGEVTTAPPTDNGTACVVRIVFPQTGSDTDMGLKTITGDSLDHIIGVPIAGVPAATNKTLPEGSSSQYAATGISWQPLIPQSGQFQSATNYTATLTLTAKPGNYFTNTPAFTHSGANVGAPTIAHSGATCSVPVAFTTSLGSVMIDVSSSVTSGEGWTYQENGGMGVYTINNGANLTVTGGRTNVKRIKMATGASATVKLSNVQIDMTNGTGDLPAFDAIGANVTLILEGTNELLAHGRAAGLQVPTGATVTIESISGAGSPVGTLTVKGGGDVNTDMGGAGIGGYVVNIPSTEYDAGHITINGGTIDAQGGHSSAGIGGSLGGNGGQITINGGIITAQGGGNAGGAGIGGGFNGNGGVITINGGTVTATNAKGTTGSVTTLGSAAIGGGIQGGAGVITIKGGCVVALNANPTETKGSGIDAGDFHNGQNEDGSGSSIAIQGGTVIVNASTGKGIGTNKGGVVNITGKPVIFAPAIVGQSSDPGNGIFIGSVTINQSMRRIILSTNITIPDGATFTVPTGWTLYGNKLYTISGAYTEGTFKQK
jgi:hypothetical protein